MIRHILIVIAALSLLFTSSGYDTLPPTEDALLCAIYFYTGDNVGDRARTTGPQISTDSGQTWNHMAWETLITNAIEIDPSGKIIYCACGNGVMASTDGGRNWRLSGGWQMAEIQDVKIGSESPMVVWAAGAYGLYLSEDGANTWARPGDPQPFRYVDTLEVDRTNPDHVLVGTEAGLYVTDDRGATYRKIGHEFPVRAIMQDSHDPNIFWMGTDGEGLLKSTDSGETWTSVSGPGDIINRVIQHPKHPDWLYCGLGHGIAFSHDDGAAWTISTEGFGEFSPVYSLLVDMYNVDRIYAGARDGLYISDDGGLTWHTNYNDDGTPVLGNAVILDLWQGGLWRGYEEPPSDAPGTLVINNIEPTGDEYRDDVAEGFEDRVQALKTFFATRISDQLANLEEGRHVDTFGSIALINEGLATDALWNELRARYSDFGHSMFDSYPAIAFYMNTKDYLPDDIKELIRHGLVSNNIYRGDTENHWLMYYTTLLLSAQEWPETSANEWYTGRTTQENYDEALGWLNEWVRITTTIGQGEFDSPHYYNMYMSPCLLLYKYAEDPMLKRRTGMIIDLLLADYAAESLYGRYCGGHSRMYDTSAVTGSHDYADIYYYLYFGEIDMPAGPHSWALTGVYSDYRCPDVIANAALMRDTPYVHTEVKRVRNQMRYSELLNSPVYKYNYMTSEYCLGSLQGGILQPIQQHTWDVTWVGSAPNTTLFSLHPYYSAYELAMFFPEDPHMLTASVQAQKSTYTNPDKLASSSPYERVFQHENTLMAVYNIPHGTTHELVTLYVPDCLNITEQDGWIFGRDGNTYIAVYHFDEGEWITDPNEGFPPAHRLRIIAGQTAFVVEIGREADDGPFEDFTESILGLVPPEITENDDGPAVNYVNRHGRRMEYDWADDLRTIDGEAFEFAAGKLFNGPFIHANVADGIIEIADSYGTRTLDFNNLTIMYDVNNSGGN